MNRFPEFVKLHGSDQNQKEYKPSGTSIQPVPFIPEKRAYDMFETIGDSLSCATAELNIVLISQE